MTSLRAWQAVEEVPGKGSRHLSYLELDFGSNPEGRSIDLRYTPFLIDDPFAVMAAQAQWWSQFGAQAPLHRSVLLLRRGAESHFGSRYPGFDAVRDQSDTVISADSAERALFARSIEGGRLRIVGRRLVVDRNTSNGQPPGLLDVMVDRMYREGRLLYFPSGKSDFRTTVPEPSSIDLVGPLSCYAGILAEQVRARGAVAGFNSGFFVLPEEEFSNDIHAYALDPVGLVIVDGKVISPPVYRRSALLLARTVYRHAPDEARYSLGGLRPTIVEVGLDRYAVRLPGDIIVRGPLFSRAELPVRFGVDPQDDHVAQLNPASIEANAFAFYTRLLAGTGQGRTATRTPAAPGRLEVAIVGQQVCAVRDGGSSYIPGNGFVVSMPRTAASERVLAAILTGTESRIQQEIDLGPTVGPPAYGCQVSLRLIVAGRATNVLDRFRKEEDFVPAHAAKQEPGVPPIHLFEEYLMSQTRAFIGFGIRPDNRCFVVVIEGCESRSLFVGSDSVGGSLEDLTRCLLTLGCTEAVALDSGGSSEIVFAGRSIVRPMDRNDVPLIPQHRLNPGGWLVFPPS